MLARAMGTVLVLSAVLIPIDLSGAASRHVVATTSPSSSARRALTAPIAPPLPVQPYAGFALADQGVWHAVGRRVHGVPAVYTTTIRLPGAQVVRAGLAWMDLALLRARLYSGSLSPGGLSWKYTAPISQSASRTLVAAFAGGFLLKDSHGGYLSEGHLVAPLRRGAASLVIYRDGSATVGAWGRDVTMSANVVAVRQNLTLLVDNGRPAPGLNPHDVATWGVSLHNVVNTPRSGIGVTSNGALVYVSGPMTIVELAQLLVRAGAVRAMTLDMNPWWPVFATYAPTSPTGFATPANGRDLLSTMIQTPARFFDPAYSRDFVTLSAR